MRNLVRKSVGFVLIVCVSLFVFAIVGCKHENDPAINQEKTITAKVVSPPYIGGADYNPEKSFSVLVEVLEPSTYGDNFLLCYSINIDNLAPYTNAATILHHAMITGEIVRLTGVYGYLPGVNSTKTLFKIHTVTADGYTIDMTKDR